MRQMMKAPTAPIEKHREQRHGAEVADNYHWLRDREDPRVESYLREENDYAESMMAHTERLQQTLFDEILGRIQEDDSSVPVANGAFFYYGRTEEGKPYAIHCRKPREGGDEQLLLDENALAEGESYFQLGASKISPDHSLLAYAFDTSGDEKYRLRVVRLADGEVLDEIPECAGQVQWALDGETLFYTTLDDAHRPWRLHRHRLGEDAAADPIVFEEPDGACFVAIDRTKDRRFLLLHIDSNDTSEVRYLAADEPQGEFRTIEPRRKKIEYGVEHHGGFFYILTNDDAVNFKLVRAPVATPGRSHWGEVVAHDPQVKLDAIEVFVDHLVLAERRDGMRGVRVLELPSLASHRIEFPEPVYTVSVHRTPEFESSMLRFSYTSLVTPSSVYDYDLRTRERELRKRQPVKGGYDPGRYASERVEAMAADGTPVPISLVYRRDLRQDGGQPLMLYGYGAYGISIDPTFDSSRLSLLDRGMVYAIAHVRGGGEMGRPWYEAGKLRHKRNSFTDFITAAEHLIEQGYAAAGSLAMRGGSAGGLLMGAVINMRPDLPQAVVAKVPFVDVVNTMSDETIPLTVIEWDEWGNPQQKGDHDYIRSYSPYDNVAEADYPNLLIMAGLNDPRVAYWEPAKWAAKLRAVKSGERWLLLKTHMGAGHGGASGRYEAIKELAFEYAFVLDRLGLNGEAATEG